MNVPRRVADRISAGIRKYQKVFSLARDRDINESDTVVMIADFVSEVLGFDKYSEVTTEFSIRGTYCDLAVKIGGEVYFLLEAKAVGITLKDSHLRQAVGYAAQHGVQWVLLTNGATWQVYRMRFEQPIKSDLVFRFDLSDASPRDQELIERLFLLSKEGMAKSAIEEFQQKKDACNSFVVGATLLSDAVLAVLRRELRRSSPGAKIGTEELRTILKEEVLKREVVEGEKAQTAMGRIRRASSRALRRRAKVKKSVADEPVTQISSDAPAVSTMAGPQGEAQAKHKTTTG